MPKQKAGRGPGTLVVNRIDAFLKCYLYQGVAPTKLFCQNKCLDISREIIFRGTSAPRAMFHRNCYIYVKIRNQGDRNCRYVGT